MRTQETSDYPTPVGQLLDPYKVYVMPLYQRTYCWTAKAEKTELRLFKRDLSELYNNVTGVQEKEVFLGAIILSDSIHEIRKQQGVVGRSERFLEVIDGQQRLTTLYLMYAAAALHAKERGWKKDYEDLIDTKLARRLGRNTYIPNLEPTSEDLNQFNVILEEFDGDIDLLQDPLGPKSGKLTDAFEFLRFEVIQEEIKKIDPGQTEKQWFDLYLHGLDTGFVVADIVVNKKHDANEVFTRLNTAGQRLSRVDHVRNAIFQKLRTENVGAKKEKLFYAKHWSPFEKALKPLLHPKQTQESKDKQSEGFFLPYARNLQQGVTERSLQTVLENSWTRKKATAVIAGMEEYIGPYFVWVHDEGIEGKKATRKYEERIPPTYSQPLKDAITRMHQLRPNNTVAFPFLMRCLFEVNKKALTEKDVVTSLRIMESFFVRRQLVTGEEGTGYHAIFQRLWFDTHGDPGRVLKKMPTGTKWFPDDEKFKQAIRTEKLYGKRHLPNFCVGEYEKYLSGTRENPVYDKMVQVDHMMAQNLKDLSDEERPEHERTVDLWGNLVPMGKRQNGQKYNKRVKDIYGELVKEFRFETTINWKRTMERKKMTDWTPKGIDERCEVIAEWAVKRFPSDLTDFRKPIPITRKRMKRRS